MKLLLKVFAWISVVCGLTAYFTGWIALSTQRVFWNIPTKFWFYDAIAAGIFGLFFLIYSMHIKTRMNNFL